MILDRVREILQSEADAITSIPINESIEHAVRLLADFDGIVFTTGIGKAGYVARKAASTLSTTGLPSAFLHPGDAAHGDVGVVSKRDILLAFSNSGKTREVTETCQFCRNLGVKAVLVVTGDPESPLAKESDIILSIGKIKEPCPLGFTPTASTTAMAALLDSLALCVMEARGFSKGDFAVRHHGGYLGEKSRK